MRIKPEALKRIRERRGHTQSSLARASRVAQTRISKLESANPPAGIRPPTAKALADALGIDITEITTSDPLPAEVAS